MNNATEALIALMIIMVVLLGVAILVLLLAIKQHHESNKEQMLKMNVIVDNLIEIVTEKIYGKGDEESE